MFSLYGIIIDQRPTCHNETLPVKLLSTRTKYYNIIVRYNNVHWVFENILHDCKLSKSDNSSWIV